jgi:hypothetical protein
LRERERERGNEREEMKGEPPNLEEKNQEKQLMWPCLCILGWDPSPWKSDDTIRTWNTKVKKVVLPASLEI